MLDCGYRLARVYKILLAICARFWHPVSYILHVLPYQGLFHLFGQNFGQTRGPRCCNFRRGDSASYFRGERCDRWGPAVGRKLTKKVKKAPTRCKYSVNDLIENIWKMCQGSIEQ